MWLKVWYIFYGIRTKSSGQTPRTKSPWTKSPLGQNRSCEHTHFDHLLCSAMLHHFITMEYITSNKGGRKRAFENNIYIKQEVLGDFVWGDFVLGGILSRGILSGEFFPGDFVLEPYFTSQNPHWKTVYLLRRQSFSFQIMLETVYKYICEIF